MVTPNLKNIIEPGNSTDKKKTIVAGIVAVVLVVILVWFFLGRQQFAGKAIYTETVAPSLSVTGDLSSGGRITINADVGTRTMTGATFDLQLPVPCAEVIKQDLLGGLLAGSGRSSSYTCNNHNLHFDDGLLGSTETGIVPLLEIGFSPALTSPASLQFTRFEIVDGTNRYVTPTLPAAFNCQGTSCTAGGITSPAVCGDGTVTPPEVCEQGQTQTCQIDVSTGTETCLPDCSGWGECTDRLVTSTCGDNSLDRSTEECDDGNIIPGDGCSADCILETTECPTAETCPATTGTDVNTFCTIESNDAICRSMCSSLGLCPSISGGALPADLNGDGIVGNDELFIIKLALFAKDSEPQQNCGGESQPFCHFADQGYYICENLEFIQIITGSEAPAARQLCGGTEHITGSG